MNPYESPKSVDDPKEGDHPAVLTMLLASLVAAVALWYWFLGIWLGLWNPGYSDEIAYAATALACVSALFFPRESDTKGEG